MLSLNKLKTLLELAVHDWSRGEAAEASSGGALRRGCSSCVNRFGADTGSPILEPGGAGALALTPDGVDETRRNLKKMARFGLISITHLT